MCYKLQHVTVCNKCYYGTAGGEGAGHRTVNRTALTPWALDFGFDLIDSKKQKEVNEVDRGDSKSVEPEH